MRSRAPPPGQARRSLGPSAKPRCPQVDRSRRAPSGAPASRGRRWRATRSGCPGLSPSRKRSAGSPPSPPAPRRWPGGRTTLRLRVLDAAKRHQRSQLRRGPPSVARPSRRSPPRPRNGSVCCAGKARVRRRRSASSLDPMTTLTRITASFLRNVEAAKIAEHTHRLLGHRRPAFGRQVMGVESITWAWARAFATTASTSMIDTLSAATVPERSQVSCRTRDDAGMSRATPR